jgi:hypothetical protein
MLTHMRDTAHDAEHVTGFTYRQDEDDGIREYLEIVKENEC